MGHTAAAAGVAGLTKLLLALQHRQIPPSLHYEEGNPHIDFEGSPFYVNTRLKEWEVSEGSKRRGAVSSFGFSGTNAHVVVEEAPRQAVSSPVKPGHLIVLSARTGEQLRAQAEQLVAHCEAGPVDCGHMSYTLLVGRRHFAHRLACVVRDCEELTGVLRQWLTKGKAVEGAKSLDDNKIADYLRANPIKTIMGDVKFGKNGEWAESGMMQVQYHDIKSNL